MKLTLFSDYTLRTLIYLGTHLGQTVPASAISEAFGTSSDHMAKAAKWLTQRGYVAATRGKHGGLQLASDPASIRIGALLRETESNLALVECFGPDNTCPISPLCKLKGVLYEARAAFFTVLDRYTLADLLVNGEQLIPLLGRRELKA
jgi:Rrf2 family nitric oxide-sensitive transcriptional repressor